jgi:GNAT superfamily N-acetyltransferase
VEIRPVTVERLPRVADVLGRALSQEPMLTWPIGGNPDGLVTRCIDQLTVVDGPLVDLGMVWEAGDALGAAVWVPATQPDEFWTAVNASDAAQRALTDDNGARMDRLWGFVTSMIPPEPLWILDHIGVDPRHQGLGVGAALIEFGLERARHEGVGAFLETGTERNVDYYRRFGFEVVAQGSVPGDGIPLWFMQWRSEDQP